MYDVYINWLAIALCTGAYFLLGSLWYSPLMFGTIWAKIVHITEEDAQNVMQGMVGSVVVGLMMSLGLSYLIHKFAIIGWQNGLIFGFQLWLFIILPTHITEVLWAKKHPHLLLINMAYKLLFMLGAATIMAAWNIP